MATILCCGFLTFPKGIFIQLKNKLNWSSKTYLPEGFQFPTCDRKERQCVFNNQFGKHSRFEMEAGYVGSYNKKIHREKNQETSCFYYTENCFLTTCNQPVRKKR